MGELDKENIINNMYMEKPVIRNNNVVKVEKDVDRVVWNSKKDHELIHKILM